MGQGASHALGFTKPLDVLTQPLRSVHGVSVDEAAEVIGAYRDSLMAHTSELVRGHKFIYLPRTGGVSRCELCFARQDRRVSLEPVGVEGCDAYPAGEATMKRRMGMGLQSYAVEVGDEWISKRKPKQQLLGSFTGCDKTAQQAASTSVWRIINISVTLPMDGER